MPKRMIDGGAEMSYWALATGIYFGGFVMLLCMYFSNRGGMTDRESALLLIATIAWPISIVVEVLFWAIDRTRHD